MVAAMDFCILINQFTSQPIYQSTNKPFTLIDEEILEKDLMGAGCIGQPMPSRTFCWHMGIQNI
jgi:hypothetical protein